MAFGHAPGVVARGRRRPVGLYFYLVDNSDDGYSSYDAGDADEYDVGDMDERDDDVNDGQNGGPQNRRLSI